MSASSPSPLFEDATTTSASARKVPATSSETSSSTRADVSASTVSALVMTTIPCFMSRRRQMSKCSRVWGMTPSSAATTKITASIPLAPANMFLMNLSCPGTSTKPMRTPSRASSTKPRSMVIPRRFSSGNRSVSTPVRARTSEVLPWSMCPAVPTIKSID